MSLSEIELPEQQARLGRVRGVAERFDVLGEFDRGGGGVSHHHVLADPLQLDRGLLEMPAAVVRVVEAAGEKHSDPDPAQGERLAVIASPMAHHEDLLDEEILGSVGLNGAGALYGPLGHACLRRAG